MGYPHLHPPTTPFYCEPLSQTYQPTPFSTGMVCLPWINTSYSHRNLEEDETISQTTSLSTAPTMNPIIKLMNTWCNNLLPITFYLGHSPGIHITGNTSALDFCVANFQSSELLLPYDVWQIVPCMRYTQMLHANDELPISETSNSTPCLYLSESGTLDSGFNLDDLGSPLKDYLDVFLTEFGWGFIVLHDGAVSPFPQQIFNLCLCQWLWLKNQSSSQIFWSNFIPSTY